MRSLEENLSWFAIFFAITLFSSVAVQLILDGKVDLEKAGVVSALTAALICMVLCWRSMKRCVPNVF